MWCKEELIYTPKKGWIHKRTGEMYAKNPDGTDNHCALPKAEDDRRKVKLGDKIRGRWYDNPEWVEGVVTRDPAGFFIKCGEFVGYLDDADEIHIIP